VTDSAPIHVGVLGTGRIGRMHAELLARRVDGLALSAVFDRDRAAFQHAIRTGDPPPVTGVDGRAALVNGRAALVIGLAARRSVAERRPVATADVGERAGGSPVA
jgi:predicted dehydrogenase